MLFSHCMFPTQFLWGRRSFTSFYFKISRTLRKFSGHSRSNGCFPKKISTFTAMKQLYTSLMNNPFVAAGHEMLQKFVSPDNLLSVKMWQNVCHS
jgi:hypothetical protein